MEIINTGGQICFLCQKTDFLLRSTQEHAVDSTSFLDIIEHLSGYTIIGSDDKNTVPMICLKCQDHAILAIEFQDVCVKSMERLLNHKENENFESIEESIEESSLIEYDQETEGIEDNVILQDDNIEIEQEIIEESLILEEHETDIVDLQQQKKKLKYEQAENGRFKCLDCFKTFKTKDILRRHSVRHTRSKSFRCSLCPREFFYQCDLNFHLKSHTVIEKYICPECNNEFCSKSALTKHLLIHDDVRLFECSEEFCKRKFRTKYALNNHMLIHANIKPFQCKVPECNQKFTQKNMLVRHVISSHKVNFYECEYCKKESFEKHKDLRVHWGNCQSFQEMR